MQVFDEIFVRYEMNNFCLCVCVCMFDELHLSCVCVCVSDDESSSSMEMITFLESLFNFILHSNRIRFYQRQRKCDCCCCCRCENIFLLLQLYRGHSLLYCHAVYLCVCGTYVSGRDENIACYTIATYVHPRCVKFLDCALKCCRPAQLRAATDLPYNCTPVAFEPAD